MVQNGMTLSPPWVIYSRKIEALFKGDEDVKVIYNNDEVSVTIYVNNDEKAEAISKILPSVINFGNVNLNITVATDRLQSEDRLALFKKAFEGNPNVVDIFSINGVYENPVNYVIFKKEVIQYYSDNLNNPHGITSTLNEEIAKEIFSAEKSICFTTDVESDSVIRDNGFQPEEENFTPNEIENNKKCECNNCGDNESFERHYCPTKNIEVCTCYVNAAPDCINP